MCEENTSQKERFLQEVEQKLLHRELDARLLDDGQIHIRWKEKPLCSVDRDGIVRFRPADITGPEVDRQLRTVIQTAGHVKEYMRIFERAPALKAVGLQDTFKVLADFGDAVLAGRSCKTGAKFVTWEWDFDRQGVHAGHYFMENYEAAKQDFAVRAGLVESQRLFSDEQIAVIKMPASLRWRTTRHSRMPRKSSSKVCKSKSNFFCRSRRRSSAQQWNRQCNICKEPRFRLEVPAFLRSGGERSL